MFGRLRPGVSVAQAQQEMTAIASRLEREHPATNTGIAITVRPLLDKVVAGVRGHAAGLDGDGHLRAADRLRQRRELDAGAGASGRQQEVAVRLALGASPWRVVRQLLTESLLLAMAGSVLGFVAAAWGVSLADVARCRPAACRGSRMSASTSASISPRRSRRSSPAS